MAHVLVVEDEASIRLATAANLRADGHRVTEMEDGAGVPVLLGTDPPNVVILDILMPGTNGVATLDAIRRLAPDLPVIVCSGAAELRKFVEYSEIQAFLPKPTDFGELLRVVALLTEPRP